MDKKTITADKMPAEKIADRIANYSLAGWRVVSELPAGITRAVPPAVKVWDPKTDFALYQQLTLNDKAEGNYITRQLEAIRTRAKVGDAKSKPVVDWIRTSSDITGEKLELLLFDRQSCTVTEREVKIAESINSVIYKYRTKLENARRDFGSKATLPKKR